MKGQNPISRFFAVFLILILILGCSGSPSGKKAKGDNNLEGEIPDSVFETGCPGRLEPVELSGNVITIGEGSPETCTEQALKNAVQNLNQSGGGAINFNCGGEYTIKLSSAIEVKAPIIIDGGGTITLSGENKTRVIKADHYVDLVVQRLTIANGRTEESGTGIELPWYGSLKAIDVKFINNHCTSKEHDIGGGAVFAGGLSEAVFSGCIFAGNSASNGGGLLNRGSNLTLVDCIFIGNEATSSADAGQYGNGGGLYIDGMNYDDPSDFHMCGVVFENNNAKQHGSAVFSYFYDDSNSYVDKCLFKGNHFDGSPTGGTGGFYHEVNRLVLSNSTFAENRSNQHAASVFIGSGSTAEVINCTFYKNVTAGNAAGIFSGSSPLQITNCTFSENDADYGPAIFKGKDAIVRVKNTIFANNTTPNRYSALSCHEPLLDGGGNIQWPPTKPSGANDVPCTENILFADPLLDKLADNGGSTPTMALTEGSPAIDIADDCPPADQRGLPRSGRCDAGSFEFQP